MYVNVFIRAYCFLMSLFSHNPRRDAEEEYDDCDAGLEHVSDAETGGAGDMDNEADDDDDRKTTPFLVNVPISASKRVSLIIFSA